MTKELEHHTTAIDRQRRSAPHHLARLIAITGFGDEIPPESVITFDRKITQSPRGEKPLGSGWRPAYVRTLASPKLR